MVGIMVGVNRWFVKDSSRGEFSDPGAFDSRVGENDLQSLLLALIRNG